MNLLSLIKGKVMRVFAVIFAMSSAFVLSSLAQTLRQAADRDGMLVSSAVRPPQLSEPAYASTLAREFNMVEAEDAMKWWILRPDEATFDFRQGMSWSVLRRSTR